jgi:hypothetical protein
MILGSRLKAQGSRLKAQGSRLKEKNKRQMFSSINILFLVPYFSQVALKI